MYKILDSAKQAKLQVAKKLIAICIAIWSLQNKLGGYTHQDRTIFIQSAIQLQVAQ